MNEYLRTEVGNLFRDFKGLYLNYKIIKNPEERLMVSAKKMLNLVDYFEQNKNHMKLEEFDSNCQKFDKIIQLSGKLLETIKEYKSHSTL